MKGAPQPGGYQRMKFPLALSLLVTVGCGDDSPAPDDLCDTVPLPLAATAAGPVIVDAGLEVQSSGIVAVATATDPQGSANLTDVLQTIEVFPDEHCAGTPIPVQDDLVGSGIEETFGTVVDISVNPPLYNAIAAATSWPVRLDFQDLDGNHTTGRVLAQVRR
jgi:hypothetical protein